LNGAKLYHIEKQYNIPHATLHKRVKKRKIKLSLNKKINFKNCSLFVPRYRATILKG
jgi:hypothetical protein